MILYTKSLVFDSKQYFLGDCFVGYNADTPAAVLLETLHDLDDNANDELVCMSVTLLGTKFCFINLSCVDLLVLDRIGFLYV